MPSTINLGTASNYTILAETGITAGSGSNVIIGNIAVSPSTSTSITGFALVLDGSGQFSTSSQVSGRVYAADYSPPTPANLTTAVTDMTTAYNNAIGATPVTATNLGAGDIGGLTFTTGIYYWTTAVTMPTSITLSGSSTDVFIFQISGALSTSSSTVVTLTGGAQAYNVFWAVAGAVTLGASSTFNGIILGGTSIGMASTAALTGRALAQTAVTLAGNDITPPAVVSTSRPFFQVFT
jgi:Ice-binding-like